MDGTLSSNDFPPPWLIRTCRFLWGIVHGWWSIGFGLFWNIVAALLVFPISPLSELTQLWAFQYKFLLIVGLLLFLCFTLFIGYISKFETTPSHYARQRHYLQQMILDHELLQASGIPEIFFPPSINLEEVFIPLEFINERTPAGIDYPLREEEIPIWQRLFARLKRRPPRELTDRLLRKEKIEIAQLWQSLSREHPLAIVQGYPGMGKSTLMKRLTLHMARRCLRKPDALLPVGSPPLVPLLIELKKYADAFKKAQEKKEELSLSRYLPQMLQKRTWQGKDPWSFISRSLAEGACLVLFDGLDEAGNAETRKQIAREINAFILEQRNTSTERKTFNRFVVTSRVAGYSPEAFPDALPYHIAELTQQRMHQLLALWYRAVRQPGAGAQDEKARIQRLHAAIDERGPIFRLAENPLLLMLMAAMQKYGINLPRERAELYDTITLTLLKHRELAKDLPAIDEDEAVRRLGPLAYAMQTTEYVADEQSVKDSLRKTIRAEHARSNIRASDPVSEQDEIEKQVDAFLTLIRERSNLFVQRTGEDFSFFHQSFQEYFTARFLLNTIQHTRNEEIPHFIELARQTDDIWREPFLFAVGYQSLGRGRDQTIAHDLLQGLLKAGEQESDPTRRLHDFLLAADALIEAKAQTFDDVQEKLIAQKLLLCYLEAQHQEKFADCQKIERVFELWLLTCTLRDSQSPLLTTLCEFVQNLQRVDLQRATLTLLVMILNREDYPQLVYETFLPHLLGLADLPALNQHYQPIPHSAVVDYVVADLALVALSLMGRHGPAGLLLGSVHKHFAEEPEQLHLLARYSLESLMPLILCVVSLPKQLSLRHNRALNRWLILKARREQHPHRSVKEDLSECFAIQQELLDCAEEVCYPTSLHLLAMLKASYMQPKQAWQDVWKVHLLQQIAVPNPYIYYQEIILLWESLFPEGVQHIAEQISLHYTQGKEPYKRFAQRFLAEISTDLRGFPDWSNFPGWSNFPVRSGFEYIRHFVDFRNLQDFDDYRELRYIVSFREFNSLRSHRGFKDLRDFRYLTNLRISRSVRSLTYFSDTFLTDATVKQTIQSLPDADEAEAIDLCTILLGRILKIQIKNENGKAIIEEIQYIVDSIIRILVKTYDTRKELCETLLDILRCLPARSGEEVTFVYHLAEKSADVRVQQALALALRFALPHKDALPVLQTATSSTNRLVAEAAQQALADEQKRQAGSVGHATV